jgi:hypothetical protein
MMKTMALVYAHNEIDEPARAQLLSGLSQVPKMRVRFFATVHGVEQQ